MSLLDKGNEDVLVYPDEEWTDSDGNLMTRPSTVGIPARVSIQIRRQSGTSARRAEQMDEGDFTEQVYRMRFRRGEHIDLGPRSYVLWNGERWGVSGWPEQYNGSRRTAHKDYTLTRS